MEDFFYTKINKYVYLELPPTITKKKMKVVENGRIIAIVIKENPTIPPNSL